MFFCIEERLLRFEMIQVSTPVVMNVDLQELAEQQTAEYQRFSSGSDISQLLFKPTDLSFERITGRKFWEQIPLVIDNGLNC